MAVWIKYDNSEEHKVTQSIHPKSGMKGLKIHQKIKNVYYVSSVNIIQQASCRSETELMTNSEPVSFLLVHTEQAPALNEVGVKRASGKDVM